MNPANIALLIGSFAQLITSMANAISAMRGVP